MRFWSGVGSRETPKDILSLMEDIAFKLSQDKWILRSGGAEGADTAFETGALNSFSEVVPEIYLPWKGFGRDRKILKGVYVPSEWNNWIRAIEIASKIHPAWDKLTRGPRALHTRNVFQVIGKDLKTPSKFLICWAKPTKDGGVQGGTRTAVVLAQQSNIPVFNLWYPEVVERFNRYLKD